MHHIDVHVRDLNETRAFLRAIMPLVGFDLRSDGDGFISYWQNGKRPTIGFIEDGNGGSGQMRIAFAVAETHQVDDVAKAAAERGARNIEGPSFHAEYGDDYYAVFFEDADGNKFEVLRGD